MLLRPDAEMASRHGREQFAAWLGVISHQRDWSKSTWRQNRAAIRCAVSEDLGEAEGLWVYDAINTYDKSYQAIYGTHRRWSGRAVKQREVPETEFRMLIAQMESSASLYASLGSLWLRANLHAGLRPTEWSGAVIDEENRTITVLNAKTTNGRSHGKTRTLNMADLNDEDWGLVRKMQQEFARFESIRTPNYLANKVRTEIVRARARLKRQGAKIGNISLYSSRHQFVANLRASGLPPQEIAAMLGHATTDTQRAHYGLKARGKRGIATAKADPGDVARVIIGRDTLAAMERMEMLRATHLTRNT